MKKKYLSLVMAAMMSLGAVVQASATTTTTVEGLESETLDQTINVNGTIKSAQGAAPAGRLEVELPTAMTFTVDQNAKLKGVNYSVKNNSKEPIVVSVAEFRDSTPDSGIVVEHDESGLTTKGRDHVFLKLVGNVDNGVNLGEFIQTKNKPAVQVLKVRATSSSSMTLTGSAGNQEKSGEPVDQTGLSETFTLMFNIAKDSSAVAARSVVEHQEEPASEGPASEAQKEEAPIVKAPMVKEEE